MGKRRRGGGGGTPADTSCSWPAELHALLAPLRVSTKAHPRLIVGLTAVTRALQAPAESPSPLCILVCQASLLSRAVFRAP